MRKITILSLLVVFSFASFAQKGIVRNANVKIAKKIEQVKSHVTSTAKAAGDTIWSEDFSDTTIWTGVATGGPLNWHVGLGTDPLNAAQLARTGTNDLFVGNIAFFNAAEYFDNPPSPMPSLIEATLTLNTPIDLSSAPNIVISWDQRYAAFNTDQIFLEYSTDGTTWSMIGGAELFPNVVANTFAVHDPKYNVSSEIGGLSSVYLRFRFTATDNGGYGMQLDNIIITELAMDDIILEQTWVEFGQVNSGFISRIPKPIMDYSAVAFRSAVQNFGVNNQTNVKLNAKVTQDANSAILYDKVGPVADILSTGRDTLELGFEWSAAGDSYNFTDSSFYGILDEGYYTIDVEITSDVEDETPLDNAAQYNFAVTYDHYARDNGVRTGTISPTGYTIGGLDGDVIGVVYPITCPMEVLAMQVFIPATCALGTEFIGKLLYSADGQAASFTDVLMADESHMVTAADTGKWVTINFPLDGMSELVGPAIGDPAMLYAAAVEIYYNGHNTNEDGFKIGEDRVTESTPFSTVWNLMGQPGYGYYTYYRTPMINLLFNADGPTSVNNVVETASVKLYPNPSTGIVNITNIENANVTVYNVLGSAVMSFSNVSKSINVSDLSNGTYIVKVQSNNSVTTQKISVLK